MAKGKGKYITLAGRLMGLYKEARDEADEFLFQETGKHYDEIDPEGWYDCNLIIKFMEKYVEASPAKEKALLTLGRNIYPTLEKTVGLPPEIKSPLDALVFEAQGFLLNHQGSDVVPRKFLKKEDGHVIVQAHSVGYPALFMKGVFLGILEMTGIQNGTVTITEDGPVREYEIKW